MFNSLKIKQLTKQIKTIGKNLGFDDVRITSPDLPRAQMLYSRWASLGNQGEMQYLLKHGAKRSNINDIHPNSSCVIVVSKNYLSTSIEQAKDDLNQADKANISLYSRNVDYHKLMRKLLLQLVNEIQSLFIDKDINARVFVDSAPVLEKPLAEKSGIGFTGKHTNIINRQIGSLFFLGEIALGIELELDRHGTRQGHCGSCRTCIDICPTQAITAPYQLDVTRCISYLNIEHRGIIADELKAKMGNRIIGCDDCQLFCPWNKYAKITADYKFHVRNCLADNNLLDLLAWSESEFLENTISSPIRRIGYVIWQRNIAIALGNYLRKLGEESATNLTAEKIELVKTQLLKCKNNQQNQDTKANIKSETERKSEMEIAALVDAIDWALLIGHY